MTFEFENQRRDGSIYPVLITLCRIERAGQTYFLAAQLELTALKHKEAELAEAVRYQRQLFESITEGLAIFDAAGTLPVSLAENLSQLAVIGSQTGAVHAMMGQVNAAIAENQAGIRQIQAAVATLELGMQALSAMGQQIAAAGDQLLGASGQLTTAAATTENTKISGLAPRADGRGADGFSPARALAPPSRWRQAPR